jgi:hypothetical protein
MGGLPAAIAYTRGPIPVDEALQLATQQLSE